MQKNCHGYVHYDWVISALKHSLLYPKRREKHLALHALLFALDLKFIKELKQCTERMSVTQD